MEKEYYIVDNDRRVGPLTLRQLAERGLEPSTLVWTAGLGDWTRADCIPDLAPLIAAQTRVDEQESAFGSYARPEQQQNPQGYAPYSKPQSHQWQQPQQQYGYNNPYGGQPVNTGTNWKTLAIVATVAGFLFSCIGGILGAFAIAAANKAENAQRFGDEMTMRSSLSNCKTLCIISFILTGIGLLANVAVLLGWVNFGLTSFANI